MTEPDINTAMILGEIRGQLRELIHTGNNNAAKLDALGLRVMTLESERSRRDGASGVMSALMKSPTLGWLVGAITTVWAVATGRLHL